MRQELEKDLSSLQQGPNLLKQFVALKTNLANAVSDCWNENSADKIQ
jgi:hypothetical protein